MIFSIRKRALAGFLSLTMLGTMVASVPFTASAADYLNAKLSIFENKAWSSSTTVVGKANKGLSVESIKAALSGDDADGATITYKGYENKKWFTGSNGKAIGTTGKKLAFEAVSFKLSDVDGYTISYSVYENKHWYSGKDGSYAGYANKGYKIEAIKISIAEKAPTTVSISSVTAPADVPVDNGTTADAVLALLPTSVSANLSDGTTDDAVPVTWAAPTGFDGKTAGTFVFTGTLNANDGETNDDNVTASVNVIVGANTVKTIADTAITTTVGTDPTSQLPKTVKATYSDGTTKDVAVTWDAIPAASYANAGTFKVSGTVADSTTVKATANVTVSALTATTSATGAKIIKVAFSGAIDKTKATFAVKKGAIVINVASVAFSDDKTSATLTLASNLTAGDYTTTISGLTATALTSTFTAADQAVKSIQFTNTKAVLLSGGDITVGYKILNQYGEDVTTTYEGGIQFTPSRGAKFSASNGVLQIHDSKAFATGDTLTVTALDSATTTFQSAALTVGDVASVSDITIDGIYNSDSTAVLNEDATPSNFYLLVTAKDQYGNAVPFGSIAAGTVLTVSNSTVVNVAGGATPTYTTVSVNGTTKTAIALAGPLSAGTTNVTIISKTTGHIATYAVTVASRAKVDTLSLTTPSIAVNGEKVTIPYTAVDQNGKAVTSAAGLNTTANSGVGGMTTLTASDGAPVKFVQNYVTGVADLVLDETAATAITSSRTVVIVGITGTSKTVQFSLTLLPNAKPTVIQGTSNFTTNFAIGAVEDLALSNVTVYDQYGRAKTPTLGTASGDYQIKVSSSNTAAVKINGADSATLDGTVTKATFAAATTKGSATITLTLEDNTGAPIANSAYTFNSNVYDKAGITSYDLSDFANLQRNTDANHEVAVTVTGTATDGTKVVVPVSFYQVTTSDATVTVDSSTKKLTDTDASSWGTVTSKTFAVIVTVDAATTPVILTKNVTVVDAALAVDKLALDTTSSKYVSSGVVTDTKANLTASGGVSALINSVVVATDQFGVTLTPFTSTALITNVSNSASAVNTGANTSTLTSGDTFNVTVISSNGKVLTFKVIVG